MTCQNQDANYYQNHGLDLIKQEDCQSAIRSKRHSELMKSEMKIIQVEFCLDFACILHVFYSDIARILRGFCADFAWTLRGIL